ncbi:MAG: hypothetical protein RMJ31_00395 [Nitrososphaerota archaeon]|nr:hypothetical protein [Nitrososphaerota archaeon]
MMRMYPNCSQRDVMDLVNAIDGDKYWYVYPKFKDAIYVVALSRAKIPLAKGFQARATYVGKISVDARASRFCRRGRVLIAIREGSKFRAVSVVTWPAFIKLMRERAERVYDLLIRGGLPPFIGLKQISRLNMDVENVE